MKRFRKFTAKPSKQWKIRTISKLIAQNLVTELGELRNSIHNAINSYGSSLNNLNTLSMKKAISVFTALVVIATVTAVPVAASSDNVGPGHPLYPVDTFMEELELSLADDDEREDLLEDQLEERADEMDFLLEGEDDLDAEELSDGQQYYEDALEAFGETLDELCGYVIEDADVEVSDDAETTTEEEEAPECDLDEKTLEKVTHVGEMTLKHLEVLARVYDKQVEKENDNAASAILGAMESSVNGHKTAVSAVSKDDKDSDNGDLVEDFDLPEGDDGEEGDDTDEDSDDDEKGNRKNELKEKVKEQKEKAEKKVKNAKSKGRGR